MNTRVMFSTASDEWSTPKETFDALNTEFAFTDDPCPIGGTDGLQREWGASVFVNPPYSNIRGFMDKALAEIKAGRSQTVVFLVPSRTDTKWWHECVMPYASEIRFIKGRLKFGNSKNSAPFPSCIIIFKVMNSTELFEGEDSDQNNKEGTK